MITKPSSIGQAPTELPPFGQAPGPHPIAAPPLAPTPPVHHSRSRSDLFWVTCDGGGSVGARGRGRWCGGLALALTGAPFVATWFTASALAPPRSYTCTCPASPLRLTVALLSPPIPGL